MIHHNSTDRLSWDPIRFVLLNNPMLCVCVCFCAPVALLSPLLPNTILSWSAGPLQGRCMTTRLWSAIGWNGHPSQHLPITLPWRRVGSVVVMAGVWHSIARRKLCVNMGGERCQWPGGRGKETLWENVSGRCLPHEWRSVSLAVKDTWRFAEMHMYIGDHMQECIWDT